MGLIAWFKRKAVDAAFDTAEELLTVDTIKRLAVSGVNKAIHASTESVSDETMAKWCKGFSAGAKAFASAASALSPESEGGRNVTIAEADEVCNNAGMAVDALITEDFIKQKLKEARKTVKQKLGL